MEELVRAVVLAARKDYHYKQMRDELTKMEVSTFEVPRDYFVIELQKILLVASMQFQELMTVIGESNLEDGTVIKSIIDEEVSLGGDKYVDDDTFTYNDLKEALELFEDCYKADIYGTRVERCKDCGTLFEISKNEQRWYETKSLAMPKRCVECRRKKKAMSSQLLPTDGKVAEMNAPTKSRLSSLKDIAKTMLLSVIRMI